MDQWRQWSAVMPIILWLCWRNEANQIKLSVPSIPARTKKPPTFKRDLKEIYRLSLYLSAAERIMAARSVTLETVDRGQLYLQRFCLGSLRLGIHMLPNHHLAMHYRLIFELYGPCYAWWLFSFERFNGLNEKVNLNGHENGEMELSVMRSWLYKHRIHELVRDIIIFSPY